MDSGSLRYSIGAGVSKHDRKMVHESVAAGLGNRGPITPVLSGDHKQISPILSSLQRAIEPRAKNPI